MQTNTELFRTPFSAPYWRTASGELKKLHMLILAALFVAMRVAISSLRIPVGENLYIYISFMVTSVGSMIYGPVVAVIGAVVSDFLSFFIFSTGDPFFFGYTLSEMLGALVFALFLYRTRITVLKIALSRTLIDLFINVGLGSLWSAMLYSKGYYYYLAKSIVKNGVLLPIEIILLVVLLQVIMPLVAKYRLMPAQPTKKIPWF